MKMKTIVFLTAAALLAFRSAQGDPIQDELADAVREVINAGHLRPGFFCAGLIDNQLRRRHGDQMNDYWHNPADVIQTLLWVLPHLPDAPYPDEPAKTWKQKCREYIRREFDNYPPTRITHSGWRDGADRDGYIRPPEFLEAFEDWGPGGYSEFEGWRFHPFNFYACRDYAKEFGGAPAILKEMRDRLDAPPPDEWFYSYESEKDQGFHHALNVFIAGYMGYLGLQDLAGESRDATVESTLSRLLDLRVKLFERIDPFNIRGSECGGFIYLVPELADYLNQNARSSVQEVVSTWNSAMPYWFVARSDEQIRDTRHNGNPNEGSRTPLYAYHSLFLAKALILKENRTELEMYLDVPAFEVGDLFYIRNLVATLSAGPDSADGGHEVRRPAAITAVNSPVIYYSVDRNVIHVRSGREAVNMRILTLRGREVERLHLGSHREAQVNLSGKAVGACFLQYSTNDMKHAAQRIVAMK